MSFPNMTYHFTKEEAKEHGITEQMSYITKNGILVHFSTVPPDALPFGNSAYAINPYDKAKRYTKCSKKEEKELFGICEYGANQLVTCYKDTNVYLNRMDFEHMCQRCPHYIKQDKKTDDLYDRSIWKPFFIERWLTENKYLSDSDNTGWSVYFISDNQYIKIGYTNNVNKRLAELQVGNGRKLSILFAIPVISNLAAQHTERILHNVYQDYIVSGEWYDILHKLILSPWTRLWGM